MRNQTHIVYQERENKKKKIKYREIQHNVNHHPDYLIISAECTSETCWNLCQWIPPFYHDTQRDSDLNKNKK